MSREYDCVVVGAGLAGATLALGLARFGLAVAAVDARAPTSAAPGRDGRGLALSLSSQRLLAALDLWPDLLPVLTPIQRIEVSARGSFGSTTLLAEDMGVPALGHLCPADHLLRTLDGALASTAGLTPLLNTTLAGIAMEASRLVLTLRNGEGEQQISTRLLVAADGSHSAVRRHFDIPARLRDYQQTAIVANVDLEHPTPYTAVERFTDEGPCALLPLGGKRYVAVRCTAREHADALIQAPAAAYLADLQQRFGWRWGRFTGLGERRAHSLVLNRAERLTAPRTVLVGNAANTIHPNAAQGLNLALRDVAALLESLKDCRAEDRDPGEAGLLSDYAARRRVDHDRTAGFSDGLARLFALEVPALGFVRGAALAACSAIPLLRRPLMARLMGIQHKPAEWLRHAHDQH